MWVAHGGKVHWACWIRVKGRKNVKLFLEYCLLFHRVIQNGLAKKTSFGVAQCQHAEVCSVWVSHLMNVVRGGFNQKTQCFVTDVFICLKHFSKYHRLHPGRCPELLLYTGNSVKEITTPSHLCAPVPLRKLGKRDPQQLMLNTSTFVCFTSDIGLCAQRSFWHPFCCFVFVHLLISRRKIINDVKQYFALTSCLNKMRTVEFFCNFEQRVSVTNWEGCIPLWDYWYKK